MMHGEKIKANGGSFEFMGSFPRDNSGAVGPNEGGHGRGTMKPKSIGTQSEHKIGTAGLKEGSSNYA